MVIHYIHPSSDNQSHNLICFSKIELNQILSIYGSKVSQGVWRDYAIDHQRSVAMFSIYRSTFEKAHLKIIKKSFTNKKQKKFQLKDVNNHILKQSNRLTDITRYLEFSLKRIV